MTFQAFLFDLDGTLQDSEVLWVAATRSYLADHGVTISQDEATRLVYGHSWRDVFAGMARLAPRLGDDMVAVSHAMRPYFERLRAATDITIPGSVRLLRRLARDRAVAIVSGATRHDVAEGIERMGIGDSLRLYVGAEDYGPGKPDPSCYLLAARKLDVAPETCLVFEDAWAGIRAAKTAGMRCVALRRPGAPAQNFSEADRVLEDLGDFDPDLLSD